jgi:hypothetical protein
VYFAPGQQFGDVNDNGSTNIIDALIVAQYYVGLDPENFNDSYADVNCSGEIDITDALLIAQYYVKLIDDFPCGQTAYPEDTETPTPVNST